MKLSEAIKKRQELNKKANDIEAWFLHQKWTEKSVPWPEVKRAIEGVVEEIWHQHNELDEEIEKAIKDIEVPDIIPNKITK